MFRLKHFLLPLLILAFAAVGVTFLSPVFTLTARWSVLGGVGLLLLLTGRLIVPLKSTFGLVALTLVTWCVATTAWSEVKDLSLMKSGAFCLVVLICLAAGQSWVHQHSVRHSLSFLYLLMGVTTIAAVFGRYSEAAVVKSGPTVMYQGMVDGPNMFGSMLSMCTPVLAWNLYYHWTIAIRRAIWLGLAGLLFLYLMMSGSRSAAVVTGFCVLGMLWAINSRKRIQILLAATGLGAFGLIVSADLVDNATQFIYKSPDSSQGLLATRMEVWAKSFQQAQKGGIIGGGYGVTIGESLFARGLTSIGYGREKGNSQLAIVEETGLIGLVFYLILLAVLLRIMVRTFSRTPSGKPQVLLGIVSGTLLGLTGESVFEAWWVAPGSPECVYFWAMAGIGLGLATDPRFVTEPHAPRMYRSRSLPHNPNPDHALPSS